MKRSILVILIFGLTLSLFSINSFATEKNNININSLLEISEKQSEKQLLISSSENMKRMSIDELNSIVDIAKIQEDNESGSKNQLKRSFLLGSSKLAIQVAWLAAAEIAKRKGYKCSGTLVQCSVLGTNYKEKKGKGGLFRDKIVKTSPFKKFMKGKRKKKVVSIEKKHNKDLYYALHNFTISKKKNKKSYSIRVYDRYDFNIQNYKSLFTGFVNNWAWLCSHTGVLHNIDVNIYFNY